MDRPKNKYSIRYNNKSFLNKLKVTDPSQVGPNMDTFCVAPFIHQSTKTDGSIKACCRAKGRIASVKQFDFKDAEGTTLSDAWNWRKIRQLRLDLYNGIRNEMCKVCWDHEDANVESMRLSMNSNFHRLKDARRRAELAIKENGTLHEKPTWFEFKLNNNCNLKCRMCSPVDSSSWFKDHKLVKHIKSNFGDTYPEYVKALGLEDKALLNLYNEDNFWQEIDSWIDQGDRFQFAGGEPLYDKDHYRVLEALKESGKDLSKVELDYATNLSVLKTKNHNVLDYWKDYKLVTVGFSIDGPPGINEYIRGGSDINDIKNNVLKIRSKLDNVLLKAKFTTQALNVYYFPELVDWLYDIGITLIGVSFVSFPDHMDARIWNKEAKQEIFERYEEKMNSLPKDRFTAKRMLENVLNYVKNKDLYTEERWNRFIEWNKILDKSRNESYTNFKFLERYMNNYER